MSEPVSTQMGYGYLARLPRKWLGARRETALADMRPQPQAASPPPPPHTQSASSTSSSDRQEAATRLMFDVDGLAAAQMQPWLTAGFYNFQMHDKLHSISERSQSTFIYSINNNDVSFQEKLVQKAYLIRAETYQNLIKDTLAEHRIDGCFNFAIDMADEAYEQTEVPVFSFQKRSGQKPPLLPDMEMVLLSYFENVLPDTTPFSAKKTRAAFAGSTTGGGHITEESLRGAPFPRLRAARRFRNVPEVDFRLTSIVQCSEQARAVLRAEGFGAGRTTWAETYESKFGISLDGNGAACSRPATILRSNSVLLKYYSNNFLYYSKIMKLDKHFISINTDEDVIDIVQTEMRSPGAYEHVSQAGKELREQLLCRTAVLAYTGALLRIYQICADAGAMF